MYVSAMTSSLPDTPARAIEVAAGLGFGSVDVPPFLTDEACEKLSAHRLRVGCVALEQGRPTGIDLADALSTTRRRSVEYFRGALSAARILESPAGYVTPPTATDGETRRRWSESLLQLAAHAQAEDMRIGVEHFPRRLVPTAAATLDLLRELGHEHLGLLLDVGHLLISGEDPGDVIRAAGSRLVYVHFDDNDGDGDLHWPLLTGKLTESLIQSTLDALEEIGYVGGVCLELQAKLNDPAGNLACGKEILERFTQFS